MSRGGWQEWSDRARWLVAGLLGLLNAIAPTRAFDATHVLPATWDSLDGPWHIDMSWRLAHGQISGRDFLWPYGPLFQVVHGVGLLFPNHDQASIFRYEMVGPQIVCMLAVAAVLFSIGGPKGWRAVAFVLWPLFFNMAVKPYAAIGAAALAGWAVATATERRPVRVIVVGALLPPLITLYAFDLGLFSIAAMLSVALGVALTGFRASGEQVAIARRNAAWLAGSAAGGWMLFAIVLALLPAWRLYLPHSLQLSTGYVWEDALPTTGKNLTLLLRVAAASAVTFAACGFLVRRDWRRGHATPRAVLALAGVAVMTLGWTRYGMGRTDESHMEVALQPARLLFVLALPLALASLTRLPLRWAALALVSFALFPRVGMRSAGDGWNWLRWSITQRPFTWDPAPATIRIEHASTLRALEIARSLPGDSLYVFPWETTVPLFAPKRNPAWAMQSLAAHTDEIEEETVRRLAADPPPALVFNTYPMLDRQPMLSRTPIIYRHLLDRYELERPPSGDVASLRPLPADAPPRFREEVLPVPEMSFKPGTTGLTIPLPPGCCRVSDLFWVTIRSDKAILPALGKPGRLGIGYVISPREIPSHLLPSVQDGRPHPQLLSAVQANHPLFFTAFSRDAYWRAAEPLLSIKLVWSPIDSFTSTPEKITVERVAVLRRTSGEAVEWPAKAAADAATLARLYPPGS